ncbi:hypothetical protein EIN_475580 [Entamoeba invadens IP1]|uniref:Uncharacterized protein n=1 Tax=Entamoeba invadens IP1 TaxID=370355 RepID=A0A0A1U3X8_ENTIV|nr:hypothetical protein EIN_475580 [Entamoeba invadens IP1]ELP88866.1 hypothetical protein EIN_475580 [Entamoeba invadens IP1]|eukprot:XP_004255637.1 hypothetical protein EIN_475580 [Entamoeba invadens IP1]
MFIELQNYTQMKVDQILEKIDNSTLHIIGELVTNDDLTSMKKSETISLITKHSTELGLISVLEDLTVSSLSTIVDKLTSETTKTKFRQNLESKIVEYIKKNGAEHFLKKVPEDIRVEMFSQVTDAKLKTVKAILGEATLTGFANILNKANKTTLNEVVNFFIDEKVKNNGPFTKVKIIDFLIDDEKLE